MKKFLMLLGILLISCIAYSQDMYVIELESHTTINAKLKDGEPHKVDTISENKTNYFIIYDNVVVFIINGEKYVINSIACDGVNTVYDLMSDGSVLYRVVVNPISFQVYTDVKDDNARKSISFSLSSTKIYTADEALNYIEKLKDMPLYKKAKKVVQI